MSEQIDWLVEWAKYNEIISTRRECLREIEDNKYTVLE